MFNFTNQTVSGNTVFLLGQNQSEYIISVVTIPF